MVEQVISIFRKSDRSLVAIIDYECCNFGNGNIFESLANDTDKALNFFLEGYRGSKTPSDMEYEIQVGEQSFANLRSHRDTYYLGAGRRITRKIEFTDVNGILMMRIILDPGIPFALFGCKFQSWIDSHGYSILEIGFWEPCQENK